MPNLVVIFGPPASGKATIRHILAQQLGYKFFHNHLTANPVAALFGWATPQFGRVVDRVREMLFREAATDPSIPGIVFTFVWGIDLPEDAEFMEMTSRLFEVNGGRVYFVELLASLEARIDREGTPFRASLKPNQEDVAAARARQVQFARRYKMNTDGKLPLAYPHLIIDTEATSPSEASEKIQATFGLVRSGA
jgi:cytidylate kinase